MESHNSSARASLKTLKSIARRTTALCAAITPLSLGSVHAQDGQHWSPRVGGDIQAFSFGETVGGLSAFVPTLQNENAMLFLDVRGNFAEDSSQQVSLGLGARARVGADSYLGLNLFADALETASGSTFDQTGAGFEFSSKRLDVLANYYGGGGDGTQIASQVLNGIGLSGTQVVQQEETLSTVEEAPSGFDVGASVKLPLGDRALLRLNSGYYEFGSDENQLDGVTAGLGIDFDRPFGIDGGKLSVGFNHIEDSDMGGETMGYLSLNLPIGRTSNNRGSNRALNSFEREFTRNVQRRSWMPVETRSESEVVETQLTDETSGEGLNVFFIAASDQGAGDCTAVDDACGIGTTLTDLGDGDVFVLVDGGGDIGSTLTFTGGRQQALGGGDDGTVEVALTDVDDTVLNLTGLGGRPTIAAIDIGASQDATVAGLTISGATAISGSGFSGDIVVDDVTTTGGGFQFANALDASISVTGSDLAGTGTGLEITANSGETDIFINDNEFTGFLEDIVSVSLTGDAEMSGTISDNIITGDFSSTGSVGSAIRILADGDTADAPVGTFLVDNNTIRRFRDFGIRITAAGGSAAIDATVTNNDIAQPGPLSVDGIRVEAGDGTTDEASSICANITGNETNSLAFDEGVELQQYAGTTFALQGYTGSGTSHTQIEAYLEGNNTRTLFPSGNTGNATANVRTAGRIVDYTNVICNVVP